MFLNFDKQLMTTHPNLYSKVREKCVLQYDLPMVRDTDCVWFGKYHNFYMFWIKERRGVLYFNSRLRYEKSRYENFIRLPFTDENEEQILKIIDDLYANYLEVVSSGDSDALFAASPLYQSHSKADKASQTLTEAHIIWGELSEKVSQGFLHSINEDLDFSDDESKIFKDIGGLLISLFEKTLEVATGFSAARERKIILFQEYTESDKTTLADLGEKYSVSREQIRHRKLYIEKNLTSLFSRLLWLNAEDTIRQITELDEYLAKTEYNIVPCLCVGLYDISNKKRDAIIRMFFSSISDELIKICKEFLPKLIDTHKEKERAADSWAIYEKKIVYPSDIFADSTADIKQFDDSNFFDYHRRIEAKFSKFPNDIEVIRTPDIVYYSSSTTDHRPDFLLITPDRRTVLVLVIPTVNMAIIYNITRCNALHSFCKENGFGYLIIDDRNNSIFDLKSKELDSALCEELNRILDTNSMIFWNDIKRLKEVYTLRNEEIAAYVLQNKLHFTLEPFCIKRRKQ
ncbi:MAG: hypothetical protein IJV72_04395 [Clostridia bacterium]|nr:hypothetical protein [Clostridia bacterium]